MGVELVKLVTVLSILKIEAELCNIYIWVFLKIGETPKMDGENHGSKPY